MKGDILCQRELHLMKKKETFASTYEEALLQEIRELFQENWQQIQEGSIIPVKQAGPRYLSQNEGPGCDPEKVDFDWNMKIGDFKESMKRQ